VGDAAHSREADLWAAVLYAGPGAALSHLTAAHWRGLVAFPGPVIHVSTPRSCVSPPGLLVRGRRPSDTRPIVGGLPVTPLAETLLGLAASSPDLILVRKALARIEYAHGWLDVAALRDACGRGRPGSARLNRALDIHASAWPRPTARSRTASTDSASAGPAEASRSRSATRRSPGSRSMRSSPTMGWWSSSTAPTTTARRPSAPAIAATRRSCVRWGWSWCAMTGRCSPGSPSSPRPTCDAL
jgi:hypothetical protein